MLVVLLSASSYAIALPWSGLASRALTPPNLHPRSILEQLVESRAFLAFAVVVVALISRLHAITTVLSEELAKAATVLVRLVKVNEVRQATLSPTAVTGRLRWPAVTALLLYTVLICAKPCSSCQR